MLFAWMDMLYEFELSSTEYRISSSSSLLRNDVIKISMSAMSTKHTKTENTEEKKKPKNVRKT